MSVVLTSISHARSRDHWQGTLRILRFNWPFYVAGSAALLCAWVALVMLPLPTSIGIVLVAGATCATFWLIASLVVSHLVYDRSDIRDCRWLAREPSIRPGRWINIHAGFDETSVPLRRIFGGTGRTFDMFDARAMTERSIARARRSSATTTDAEAVDFRKLPLRDRELDVALLLLAAHELRRHDDRVALFGELHRSLRVGGRVILAEHLRDPWNFLAFGPGFLHFLPRRAWLRAAEASHLSLEREFPITPFVRVFIFGRPS